MGNREPASSFVPLILLVLSTKLPLQSQVPLGYRFQRYPFRFYRFREFDRLTSVIFSTRDMQASLWI